MKKIESIQGVRDYLEAARRAGKRVGFVPTMGAIHEGHCSLMRAARAECAEVVVSIFVNPTQFGPGEDFARYPRPIEADLAACAAERVDVVFCPAVEEMYPSGTVTTVHVARLTEGLCGAHRPGHFDGVTTVVAKLFNIVQPDVAYFGQKDAQQVTVIRRMVRDLLWPIEIVVCPTIREPDGLAMSSRNVYLNPEQRRQALCLYQTLSWARARIEAGHREADTLIEQMRERIVAAGPCTIDYIAIVDPDDLAAQARVESRCLIALAVRMGPTRLIDNILVDAGSSKD